MSEKLNAPKITYYNFLMKKIKPQLLLVYIGLFFYFLLSVIFLIQKSKIGTDYAISEMIINYTGGFSRRGLLGQVFYFLHTFFNFNLTNIIVFFQIIFSGLFTLVLFFLFKKLKDKINKFDVFILFLPTLLFYPLYELEALGRKEMLVFISFAFLVLQGNNKNLLITLTYSLLILPLIVFTWELLVFYLPFYFIVFYIQYNVKTFKESLKIFLIFVPTITFFIMIWLNPIDFEGHKVMCETIKCSGHGAEWFLINVNTDFDFWIHEKASLLNYFRYFVFLILSLCPFYIFSLNSLIKKNNLFLLEKFRYFHHVLLILFLCPVLIYLFALDWGRWTNIFITLAYLLMIFFRTGDLVKNIELQIFDKISNLYVGGIFFVYCLSWNPKLLLWDDTGSLPTLRLIIKSIKLLIY